MLSAMSYEGQKSSMMLHRKMLVSKRQASITAMDPVQAAEAVQSIPYLANNVSLAILDISTAFEAYFRYAAVPFLPTPSTNASAAGGWISIPELEGFTLNRTWEVVPGAIMPFYMTSGLDITQVKRALITFPGK
jgi:hypothetical protein